MGSQGRTQSDVPNGRVGGKKKKKKKLLLTGKILPNAPGSRGVYSVHPLALHVFAEIKTDPSIATDNVWRRSDFTAQRISRRDCTPYFYFSLSNTPPCLSITRDDCLQDYLTHPPNLEQSPHQAKMLHRHSPLKQAETFDFAIVSCPTERGTGQQPKFPPCCPF